jgi:hypothetical protein
MNAATEFLRKNYPQHSFINPLEIPAYCSGSECDASDGGDGHAWQCWMRGDIIAMMDCNAIVMLPGWIHSRGAKAEISIAQNLSFQLFKYLESEKRLEEIGC